MFHFLVFHSYRSHSDIHQLSFISTLEEFFRHTFRNSTKMESNFDYRSQASGKSTLLSGSLGKHRGQGRKCIKLSAKVKSEKGEADVHPNFEMVLVKSLEEDHSTNKQVQEVEKSDESDFHPTYKIFWDYLSTSMYKDHEGEGGYDNHPTFKMFLDNPSEEDHSKQIQLVENCGIGDFHPTYKIFWDNLCAGILDNQEDSSTDSDSNCSEFEVSNPSACPEYLAFLNHFYSNDKTGKLKLLSVQHSDPLGFRASPGASDFLDSIEEREPSKYKRRLMRALKQPFKDNEFEELLAQVTVRKPMMKDNLRGGRSYSGMKMGFSAIDHHPGLADQIARAEPPLKLLLMRSFVFWLQNVAHEGSFLPWVKPTRSISSTS